MPEISVDFNVANLHDVERKVVSDTTVWTTKIGWPKWSTILKQTIPIFEEHGWTDNLQEIRVGNKFLNGSACGEYNGNKATITLTDMHSFDGDNLVETSKKHVFIHEMVHHRHISSIFGPDTATLSRQQIKDELNEYEDRAMGNDFLTEVSRRASRNAIEAVAETGAALMQGYEYSDDIRRKYEILGGPEPIDLTRSENYGQPWPTTK